MKTFPTVRKAFLLFFLFATPLFGQRQDKYEYLCPSLKSIAPADLLRYLTTVTPDEGNRWCVTRAIERLGNASQRYEPAIPVLVKMLDFRRPQTPREQAGFGSLSSGRVFPAQDALEEIGRPALPEILRAITSDSTSVTARENAVEVWMEAYKYERPKGVALLKQEEDRASSDAAKRKIAWAVQKALIFCGPPAEKEGLACRAAGKISAP